MSLRRLRGFTIIEVLIVIAIMVILAAILFPVFTRARDKAREVQCLSNQRQISTAILIFCQESGEVLPGWATVWADIRIGGMPGAGPTLAAMRGGVHDSILRCPLRPKLDNGYVYNSFLCNPVTGSGRSLGDPKVMHAGDRVTPLDAHTQWLTTDGQHTPEDGKPRNVAFTMSDLDLKRHRQSVVASFLDGHVALAGTGTIAKWRVPADIYGIDQSGDWPPFVAKSFVGSAVQSWQVEVMEGGAWKPASPGVEYTGPTSGQQVYLTFTRIGLYRVTPLPGGPDAPASVINVDVSLELAAVPVGWSGPTLDAQGVVNYTGRVGQNGRTALTLKSDPLIPTAGFLWTGSVTPVDGHCALLDTSTTGEIVAEVICAGRSMRATVEVVPMLAFVAPSPAADPAFVVSPGGGSPNVLAFAVSGPALWRVDGTQVATGTYAYSYFAPVVTGQETHVLTADDGVSTVSRTIKVLPTLAILTPSGVATVPTNVTCDVAISGTTLGDNALVAWSVPSGSGAMPTSATSGSTDAGSTTVFKAGPDAGPVTIQADVTNGSGDGQVTRSAVNNMVLVAPAPSPSAQWRFSDPAQPGLDSITGNSLGAVNHGLGSGWRATSSGWAEWNGEGENGLLIDCVARGLNVSMDAVTISFWTAVRKGNSERFLASLWTGAYGAYNGASGGYQYPIWQKNDKDDGSLWDEIRPGMGGGPLPAGAVEVGKQGQNTPPKIWSSKADVFHHVALSFGYGAPGAKKAALYIDGQLVGSEWAWAATAPIKYLTVGYGRRDDGTWKSLAKSGGKSDKIDDFRVYAVALSQADVQKYLYKNGAGRE